jgi:hypothetical protein
MALYDPATDKWYNYNPSSTTYSAGEEGSTPTFVPSSLDPVDRPAGSPGNLTDIIDPTQNDPNALAAQLLRAQFDEWAKSFKPIELGAMNQISFNNPEVLPRAVEKATSAATGQSDTMRGVLSRSNAAMGISPTAQQAKVSDRILNLDRATSVAGAANKARENVRLQDEQVLLGGAPNQNIVKNTI